MIFRPGIRALVRGNRASLHQADLGRGLPREHSAMRNLTISAGRCRVEMKDLTGGFSNDSQIQARQQHSRATRDDEGLRDAAHGGSGALVRPRRSRALSPARTFQGSTFTNPCILSMKCGTNVQMTR
jgi:hypothetical protein